MSSIHDFLCKDAPFYFTILWSLVFFVIGLLAGKKLDVPAQMDREEFSRCVQLILQRHQPDKAWILILQLEDYCSDISIRRDHLGPKLRAIVDEVLGD